MIFLKNFYAEGFKSFARPINLNFSNTMIGIVGPNGSGKSNIVDALKWAMGEQSIKTLRGKEKTNLIFAGSNDMDEADFALVELTFDNSKRILNYQNDEVKIGRKLMRKTGESFFTINDEPARLKDIQDLFLDTGLTKGSLGIISQGTVNWFAEAKPEDRRHMFEEAAGIGRYTKQKNETLDLLEKAAYNLERLDQYEANLKREIRDLSKQAEKAVQYKEKTQELKKLDVTISVQDYLAFKDESIELSNSISIYKTDLEKLKINIEENKLLRDKNNQEYLDKDNEIKQLSQVKDELNIKLNNLNYKKIAYVNNLENNINSQNIEERKKSYLSLIASDEEEINSLEKQINQNKEKLCSLEKDYEASLELKNKLSDEYNTLNSDYNHKKVVYERLEELFKNNNNVERGVQTLLNSKNSIPGIHSTISNILQVPERYEIAIQTALGKSINNLVVENSNVAISAINFLKKNNGGRATFLPMDTIKPKNIKEDSLTIMSKLEGFIDVASNLVKYDSIYDNIIKSLLGNVAISDSIESATHIGKMVNNNYKVISLDGDIVYAGGALSGGQQQKTTASTFNIEEKIYRTKLEFEEATKLFINKKIELENVNNNSTKLNIEIQNIKGTISICENKLVEINSRLTRNKTGYESIVDANDKQKLKLEINQFEKELIEVNEKLIEVSQKISTLQNLKEHSYEIYCQYNLNYERDQETFISLNDKFNRKNNKLINLLNDIKLIEDKINNLYEMTMEYAITEYNKPLDISTNEAKSIISKLRSEIDALGNINFEAVERLDEREAELKSIETEHNLARESVINLKNIIEDLDKRAKIDFTTVINKVNEIIPQIFTSLFGGGDCCIKYTDPTNVLESGIEVVVHPLGKKVSNLVLLSGGEKTLVALTVLFALLKSSSFPLVVLDEAEAALDQANVNTFAKLIQEFSDSTQFLVITHRTGTMKMCDVLYGTTMQIKGVTKVIKTDLEDIKKNELMKKEIK